MLDKSIKVSIITVVYNGELYLEQTILSVLSQQYRNIEYIIIDGLSSDNTLNIIKKYEKKLTYWTSEKDNGIYDAMNKGIKVATGEIIGILNSDDYYVNNNVIDIVVSNYIYNKKPDILFAIMDFFNPKTNLFKSIIPDLNLLKYDMSINHPTCFVKRTLYENIKFDTSYRICADYDLMIKFYKLNKSFHFINEKLLIMRIGGASDNFFKSTREVYLIQKKYFGKKLAFMNYIVRVLRRLIKNSFLIFLSSSSIEKVKGFRQ